jgi:hypothetical protein
MEPRPPTLGAGAISNVRYIRHIPVSLKQQLERGISAEDITKRRYFF